MVAKEGDLSDANLPKVSFFHKESEQRGAAADEKNMDWAIERVLKNILETFLQKICFFVKKMCFSSRTKNEKNLQIEQK